MGVVYRDPVVICDGCGREEEFNRTTEIFMTEDFLDSLEGKGWQAVQGKPFYQACLCPDCVRKSPTSPLEGRSE